MASYRTTSFVAETESDDDDESLLESRLIRLITATQPKRPIRYRERYTEKQVRKCNPRVARAHMF